MSRYKLSKKLMIALVFLIALQPSNSYATATDYNFYAGNDILFYDPNATSPICSTSSSAAMSAAPFAATGDLPQEATSVLTAAGTKAKIEASLARYQYAQSKTNVPWQLIAALHYREAGNNPALSIYNGQPLGTGLNVDGKIIPSDPNEDAASAATTFKELAQSMYGIDVTKKDLTIDDAGSAFIAYNRGGSYKVAGVSYDKSPYVMNDFDNNHLNMTFPSLGGETLAGSRDSNVGALTVVKFIGGVTFSGAGNSCSIGGNGAIQGDIVKTALSFAWDKPVSEGQAYKADAKPTYVAAMAEFSKINNDSDAQDPFSDCGRFIANVMRASGVDKNYPLVGVYTSQLPYVQQHPELYKVIANPTMSDFQPGDIFMSTQHTALYTGKVAGSQYDTVDASLGGRVPAVSSSMTYYVTGGMAGSDVHLVRYIGGK